MTQLHAISAGKNMSRLQSSRWEKNKSCIAGLFVILLWISCAALLAQSLTPKIWKNTPEKIQINDRLSFIFHEEPASEITVIQILVKGGKRAIPASQRGLAFITLHMALEMPSIREIIQFMNTGSTFSYSVEGDYSVITVQSLTKNIENTLKITTELLKNPLFSGPRIDQLKEYMKEMEKNEEESPEKCMEQMYFDAFFGTIDWGYAGSVYGNSESREKISRKDILQFYKNYFNLSNMIIAVSSNRSKPGITKLIEKYFGNFPVGKPMDRIDIQPSSPDRKTFFIKKDNKQVLISFGVILPGITQTNFAQIRILETLLGKGIGSKLWKLRSENDLAYNLNTRYFPLKDSGLFILYLKTGIQKKDEAYKALKEIITDIDKNGVTRDELAITASMTQSGFLRQNETKFNRSFSLASFEILGIGFEYLETFFHTIDRASSNVDEFNRFIKQVLNPDRLIEVIIGPEDLNR
jgi:zinc protease